MEWPSKNHDFVRHSLWMSPKYTFLDRSFVCTITNTIISYFWLGFHGSITVQSRPIQSRQYSPRQYSPADSVPFHFSPADSVPFQFSPADTVPIYFSPKNFSPKKFSPIKFSPINYSPTYSVPKFSVQTISVPELWSAITIHNYDQQFRSANNTWLLQGLFKGF